MSSVRESIQRATRALAPRSEQKAERSYANAAAVAARKIQIIRQGIAARHATIDAAADAAKARIIQLSRNPL